MDELLDVGRQVEVCPAHPLDRDVVGAAGERLSDAMPEAQNARQILLTQGRDIERPLDRMG